MHEAIKQVKCDGWSVQQAQDNQITSDYEIAAELCLLNVFAFKFLPIENWKSKFWVSKVQFEEKNWLD